MRSPTQRRKRVSVSNPTHHLPFYRIFDRITRRRAGVNKPHFQPAKAGGFVSSMLLLSVGERATGNVLRPSKQECLSSAFMMTGDTFSVGQAEYSNSRVPRLSMHFSGVIGACFATMSNPARFFCLALADPRD